LPRATGNNGAAFTLSREAGRGAALSRRLILSRPAPLESELFLKGQAPRASRAAGPPGFHGGRPTMPKYLEGVARQEWKRIVRELVKRGTATKIDGSILELHCETYARWRACKEEVGEKYFVDIPVTDSNGAVFFKRGVNPAVATMEKCEGLMRQLLAQLGATPASRKIQQMTTEGRKRNAPPLPGSADEFLQE
jgi:P27 family predicted phage terminase small subunit